MSISAVYELKVKEGKKADLIASFQALKGSKGFEGIQVFQDQKDTDTMLFVETWDSLESQKKFMSSMTKSAMSKWMNGLMSLLQSDPSPKMYEVAETIV
jgi:heme-degrading monooxygenase HmoA